MAYLRLYLIFITTSLAVPLVVSAQITEVFVENNRAGCIQPETKSVKEKHRGRFYSWKNKQGVAVFSDRPRSGNDEAEEYAYVQRAFFEPDFQAVGGEFPFKLKAELSQDVNQIFVTLGRWLGEGQLRRVYLNVLLIYERTQYVALANRISPSLSQSTGFFSYTANQAVAHFQGDNEQTLALLRHESTHVILAGLLGQTEPWLTEGLAEYFAYSEKFSADHMKRLKSRFQIIPLPEFMRLKNRFYGEAVAGHYAQAWSFAGFLSDSRQGQKIFKAYLEFLAEKPCRAHDSSAFFDQNYPGGLYQLERDWLSFYQN